jgi:hypothetical protein
MVRPGGNAARAFTLHQRFLIHNALPTNVSREAVILELKLRSDYKHVHGVHDNGKKDINLKSNCCFKEVRCRHRGLASPASYPTFEPIARIYDPVLVPSRFITAYNVYPIEVN